MPRIKTRLDTSGPAFQENAAHHRALAEDLRSQVARLAEGGGADAQKKHTARGKLLPRDRVRALLDPGAPFLELSQLAAFGMYGDEAPAALPYNPPLEQVSRNSEGRNEDRFTHRSRLQIEDCGIEQEDSRGKRRQDGSISLVLSFVEKPCVEIEGDPRDAE